MKNAKQKIWPSFFCCEKRDWAIIEY